jgi:ankyrin repeat protein
MKAVMKAVMSVINLLSRIRVYLIIAILLLAFVNYSQLEQSSQPEEQNTGAYSQFEFLQAVYKGDLARVEALLSSGCSPNTRQIETPITHSAGDTALVIAAFRNHTQVAELLIRSGADVNEGGYIGRTPLLKANSLAMTDILIRAGADVNKSDQTGRTPLMVAGLEEAKLLLGIGVDVNAKDSYGVSALMYAAQAGDCETVKLLISHGADINATSKDGWTALISAASFQDPCTAEALSSSGADPNSQTAEGDTALMHAAMRNCPETARVLLRYGADDKLRADDGSTALSIAESKNRRYGTFNKVISLLRGTGAKR